MYNIKKTFYINGKINVERHYLNGNFHRLDGPAIINYWDDGEINFFEYWVNGFCCWNKESFLRHVKQYKLLCLK